mmetsp:Transcript_5799/g.21122  ORF Transcript_5799/g.21122 Transcript_5799/m.21122 type:complete len:152 (-) Transcript_5799:119-574(-)
MPAMRDESSRTMHQGYSSGSACVPEQQYNNSQRVDRYELFVVPLTTVVGILPVVGPILGSTLQLSVTSFTIGWELLDVWCEKQGLSFTEQQKLVEDKRFTVIGFGLPFSMMLAVPLIGPLSIGIAQSAAATFVVKEFPKLQAGPARRQEGE